MGGWSRTAGRTTTPVSLDDARTWRKVLARLHPDAGGSEDLFVFGQAVRERVAGEDVGGREPREADESRRRPPPRRRRGKPATDKRPIPFETDLDFEELTARAVSMAPELEEPYRWLFEQMADCSAPGEDEPDYLKAEALVGACYRRLAKVGRLLGLDGKGRNGLYKAARRVPLSDRHARHLLRVVDDEGRRP